MLKNFHFILRFLHFEAMPMIKLTLFMLLLGFFIGGSHKKDKVFPVYLPINIAM